MGPVRILTTSRDYWRSLRDYLGGRRTRVVAVTDVAGLANFLYTRAAHVAQTSLYGYLRTRAGMRYPELFENDEFLVAVNIAKWQVWLACLSDLAVYAGGLVRQSREGSATEVARMIVAAAESALDEAGTPGEAGDPFAVNRDRLRARLATIDWTGTDDEEAPFSESPAALVEWAPIVDELKELDSGIVRNSVRFRWQEVRRELRDGLDAAQLMADFRSRSVG